MLTGLEADLDAATAHQKGPALDEALGRHGQMVRMRVEF